jgi:hypothetical protein
LTASASRWQVTPIASPTAQPRWTVELVQCKGLAIPPSLKPGASSLIVEWEGAQGVVTVCADVVDRPVAPAASTRRIA